MKISNQFITWIMCCVRSITYSILINGNHSPTFKAKRGARQGDPLSLYLFILSMDYLTRLLKTLKTESNFKYHSRCHKQNIIQLSFANDLLLFCRGDLKSTKIIFDCFQQFFKTSGLIANKAKSYIYFGGVSENVQQEILMQTSFTRGSLLFRYLGVPLSSKKLSIGQCQALMHKILGQITTCTTKFLSYARRLQLIMSVLESMQAFWAQIFFMPKKII